MKLNNEPEETGQIVEPAPAHSFRPDVPGSPETLVIGSRTRPAVPAGVTDSTALSELIAASDQETAARRRLPWLAVVVATQAALIGMFPNSPFAALTYTVTIFSLVFILGRFAMDYRRTTTALVAADDVRMVGPLIDRLRIGRRRLRTRRAVRQALTRLLPRLRASDSHLITSDQQGRLTRSLAQMAFLGRETEFQIAILRAFQQVGGAQALPVVEGLAEMAARSPERERVKAAAEECLPYLQARADHERSRETLLRAASELREDGGELLRAAKCGAAIVPAELLRAADGSAEGELHLP